MFSFIYTARNVAGEKKSGTLEAESEASLAHVLREQGYILTSCHKSEEAKIKINLGFLSKGFNHVFLVEKMIFTKNLAVMIKAGLSVTKALDASSQQTKSKYFAGAIKDICSSIQSGQAFGDALAKYPNIFSDLYVSMVRAGEVAGNLEEILNILAEQMKKDHELVSRVRGAMIYPSVIVGALILIGSLMMIFVVPKLTSIFQDFHVDLPFTTKIVIAVSNAMSTYTLFFALALLAAVVAVILIHRKPQGKKAFDAMFLKMPVFGSIIKKVNSARFSRIFSSLIASGVPIVKALEITSDTLGNSLFSLSLKESSVKIQQGVPLSSLLENYKNLYPPMVIQMVQVGEETGTLSEILKRLAEFYEDEVTDLTKNLSSIIEPILMIVIGGAVGFFAVSMLQPMYSIMNSM